MIDLSRLLVTGGYGMVGQALPFGIKTSHHEIDVLDKDRIRAFCDRVNPSGILCLSSVNLRNSEKNPMQAYAVNVFGVYNLACEALRREIPIILVSSGTVFQGPLESLFSEDDLPNPKNIYGQTKYLAEILVRSVTDNYLILRTGWLFGGKTKTSPVDKMIGLVKNSEEITATIDQKGSPTYLLDFVEKMKELIDADARGLIHVVNEGAASAADVTQEIIAYVKSEPKLHLVKMSDLTGQPPRSASEVLFSKKIKLRHWKEALKDYLNSLG